MVMVGFLVGLVLLVSLSCLSCQPVIPILRSIDSHSNVLCLDSTTSETFDSSLFNRLVVVSSWEQSGHGWVDQGNWTISSLVNRPQPVCLVAVQPPLQVRLDVSNQKGLVNTHYHYLHPMTNPRLGACARSVATFSWARAADDGLQLTVVIGPDRERVPRPTLRVLDLQTGDVLSFPSSTAWTLTSTRPWPSTSTKDWSERITWTLVILDVLNDHCPEVRFIFNESISTLVVSSRQSRPTEALLVRCPQQTTTIPLTLTETAPLLTDVALVDLLTKTNLYLPRPTPSLPSLRAEPSLQTTGTFQWLDQWCPQPDQRPRNDERWLNCLIGLVWVCLVVLHHRFLLTPKRFSRLFSVLSAAMIVTGLVMANRTSLFLTFTWTTFGIISSWCWHGICLVQYWFGRQSQRARLPSIQFSKCLEAVLVFDIMLLSLSSVTFTCQP